MKRNIYILPALLTMAVSCSSADKDEPEVQPEPTIPVLTSFSTSECKDFIPDEIPDNKNVRKISRHPYDDLIPTKTHVIVSLEDSVLHLKVQDIYQNCMFSSKVAFAMDKDTIAFNITRAGRPVDCICFFDIDAEVADFAEGNYFLKVCFSGMRRTVEDSVKYFFPEYEFPISIKNGDKIIKEFDLFRAR